MNWLKNKLCDWFHAGGDIKRDCHGRINWQCRTCSRWAIPVNPQTERLITDNAAGASFTPSERMRITSGGNVLVNTTTDNGLHIYHLAFVQTHNYIFYIYYLALLAFCYSVQ